MRFTIFPLHLSRVLRLPRKSEARSDEMLHLSRKIIFANLKIWCSKMQALSGNQCPDLLTSLMNMSLVLRLPREICILADRLQMSHACQCFWTCYKTLTFSSKSDKVPNPLRLPRETTSERPKVVRARCALYLLTWKCASRRNGVHFFDITTSKSGPSRVCFVHFDLEMCFALQWRALFRHLNFQKWSKPGVLCTFWIRHVLRATTACTFSISQLPKMVRMVCFPPGPSNVALFFAPMVVRHRNRQLDTLFPVRSANFWSEQFSWVRPIFSWLPELDWKQELFALMRH